MAYFLHIFIIINNIYIIIAISLNLIAGYTGILSIARAAFYGVGAYVAAGVAFPSLRIHADCLVTATLSFRMNGSLFFPYFTSLSVNLPPPPSLI